jgi:glucose/arabinose dehydrogenase
VHRRWLLAALGLIAAGAAAVAHGAGSAALPRPAGGYRVALVGTTAPTPTQIAVGSGRVFVAAAGSDTVQGGVFVLGSNGAAMPLPESPPGVYGVAWHGGTLYVSAGTGLLAWSGWDGTDFARQRYVAKLPDGFSGFSGLAVDARGRIWTGVQIADFKSGDHAHGTTLYANDLLRIDPSSGAVAVVARNIRQPWQLTFPAGSQAPVVTDLGQDDLGAKEPPDLLIAGRPGSDFGFPSCTWAVAAACARYAKPLWRFPAHSSPMGIAAVGRTVVVALYGGLGQASRLVRLPASGGTPSTIVSGFPASARVMAVGAAGSVVYAGDESGRIFRVTGG